MSLMKPLNDQVSTVWNLLPATICTMCPKKVHFFRFTKVKWLQYTGKVGTSYRCQIFSRFNTPKIIEIGRFLTELLEK